MGGLFGGGKKKSGSASKAAAQPKAESGPSPAQRKRMMAEQEARQAEGDSEIFMRKNKLSSMGEKTGAQSPSKLGG